MNRQQLRAEADRNWWRANDLDDQARQLQREARDGDDNEDQAQRLRAQADAARQQSFDLDNQARELDRQAAR